MSLGLPNYEDVNDIFLEVVDSKKFKISIEDLIYDRYGDSPIPVDKRHLIGTVCINRIEFDGDDESHIGEFNYMRARVVSTRYEVSHRLKCLVISRDINSFHWRDLYEDYELKESILRLKSYLGDDFISSRLDDDGNLCFSFNSYDVKVIK
jgi:hypothetical protein